MGAQVDYAQSHHSDRSSSSGHSYASDHSRSTAPTVYSERPQIKHFDTSPPNLGDFVEGPLDYRDIVDARTSVQTYSSTVPSSEDLNAQPEFAAPPGRVELFPTDAVPSTPPEFGKLFHVNRRLLIYHDESTSDGNMNLRIDTDTFTPDGLQSKMTLFHLRMQDLRERQFSLRRYCRESRREVCHSTRKYAKPTLQKKRPTFQRSLSSALQTLGLKTIALTGSKGNNDGYDSGEESDDLEIFTKYSTEDSKSTKPCIPTNIVRLEFANYAQVEVHIRGTRNFKRYEYDYWGTSYYWKREVRKEGSFKEISYHLVNAVSSKSIAHITPEPLTRREAMDEEYRGGWVPPCSLFITDKRAFSSDAAEVVVATGLIALVDDCIRRRWHNKGGVRLNIPVKKKTDYISPQRLIDEVFNR